MKPCLVCTAANVFNKKQRAEPQNSLQQAVLPCMAAICKGSAVLTPGSSGASKELESSDDVVTVNILLLAYTTLCHEMAARLHFIVMTSAPGLARLTGHAKMQILSH